MAADRNDLAFLFAVYSSVPVVFSSLATVEMVEEEVAGKGVSDHKEPYMPTT